MNSHILEDRLIHFAVQIIELIACIPESKISGPLTSQLIRSATSPALNYGEAQSGESRKDFIHKLKIISKELRETSVCLKIISRGNLCESGEMINALQKECNELISIFIKSIKTAQSNAFQQSEINKKIVDC